MVPDEGRLLQSVARYGNIAADRQFDILRQTISISQQGINITPADNKSMDVLESKLTEIHASEYDNQKKLADAIKATQLLIATFNKTTEVLIC